MAKFGRPKIKRITLFVPSRRSMKPSETVGKLKEHTER